MISVVVSTYDYPRALDAVLRALSEQSDGGFEVVVADDGSRRETGELVDAWQSRLDVPLRYVRQSDEGFRVARIRNVGALVARGTHLAFLDGDCVPRRHFVRSIRRGVTPGRFAATFRYELSRRLTEQVLDRREPVGRWGLAAYARNRREIAGYAQWLVPRRRGRGGASGSEEFVPPFENYGFVALARSDFEDVNGYDLRYEGWGGEDPDLAIRLRRLGLRCAWPGRGATLFHLWHPSRRDAAKPYLARLRETRRSERVEAVVGLRELAPGGRAA